MPSKTKIHTGEAVKRKMRGMWGFDVGCCRGGMESPRYDPQIWIWIFSEDASAVVRKE